MLGWFRRHAKILMVVLGSSAMAIFGLGPVFDTLAQRGLGGGPTEEVVATWKGGKITRTELEMLRQRHYQTRRFLDGVRSAATTKKGGEFRSLASPVIPLQDGQQELVDDQLISRLLMAEKAKEEGVVASDGMIDDYLQLASGDAGFSLRDLEIINKEANNNYCSLKSVKEHLKLELLNNQMSLFTLTGIPMIPNASESIELHGRTTGQIECEVLAVDVNEYLEKVSEKPSPSELKKLYDEGKYEFPDPMGEKPGFKVSRKVDVQYLMASYEKYLQAEMAKLTDEEIQKEYDRLVAEKNQLVTEVIEPENTIDINAVPPSDVEPPATEGGTDAPATEGAPSDVAPPPMEKKDDAPAVKLDAPAVELDAPATETPKVDLTTPKGGVSETEEPPIKLSEPKTEGGEAGGQPKKQSLKVTLSKSSFVSLQEEAKQESSEKTTEETAPPETQVELAAPAAKQETAETAGAESTAAQTLETETKPSDQDEVGGIGAIADAVEKQADMPKAPEVETRIKPLKEVVDEVKRSMCETAARQAMEKSLTKASVMVTGHFNKIIRYDVEKERGEAEDPGVLDIEKLASDYNLVAKETGLRDFEELGQDPVGQVRILTQRFVQGRQIPQLQPVNELIFNQFGELRLYDSQTVNDNWGSGSSYLFWLSGKEESRIPTFEECKDDVEAFWKRKRAFELAKADAEAIMTKVNDARTKKLSELYNERVFQTGAFSWFNNFGSVQLARPAGVSEPGNEFMSTAFSLGKLQAGVAANEPKDKIYVVQSINGTQSPEEIGMDYLKNQLFKYKAIPNEVQRVSQWYGRELNFDWNDEFKETMNLKYINR